MRQTDAQLAAGTHTDRHERPRLEFRCETITLGIAWSVLVPGFEFRHLFNCITHSFVLVLLNVRVRFMTFCKNGITFLCHICRPINIQAKLAVNKSRLTTVKNTT
jgi:hypothetical protein